MSTTQDSDAELLDVSRTSMSDATMPHTVDGTYTHSLEMSSGAIHDTRRIDWYLYTSHFLSTWNSRVFEFGAYIFLASIYPQTLLQASIYALSRAACAALVTPFLGGIVDRGERLRVVRMSIVGQRAAVAISCAILLFMVQVPHLLSSAWQSYTLLTILCVLAIVEKLSSVVNTISIERDWVVVIAQGQEQRLGYLNSQMRRIDLFCKLIGPLVISFIDAASTNAAITVTGVMTCMSIVVEYLAISNVHRSVPALQTILGTAHVESDAARPGLWREMQGAMSVLTIYVKHPAFLPSFALALLYLTVLSFSGQLITYLLALGVSSGLIGLLRGIAALFELSATWLGPELMKRIGPIRAGIWFINWQIVCVFVACLVLWLDDYTSTAATGTICAVIASRIGLWGFDLSVQIIVQEEVQADLRGAFSSQEFALQNIFEMLSFASTVVFARPDQFKIPATISATAVGMAGVLYATFVRSRRGHLIHLSQCMSDRQHKSRHGWSRVSQDADDVHEMT